ncbi:MAG: hypothetical protein DRJ49_02325 [Thermoprotei archaeon]|nr:MAG: hypothetical protein DRN53_02750 [Thermoprotei archaeon]RLE89648.1 MAG: hypothetical protein DRJ49_02325 [Thermoprotei archaeon]
MVKELESRDLALAAVVGSMYVILVALLPVISFHLVQVRVADALIPLSSIYGIPIVVGVSVGCLLANWIASPWGIYQLTLIDCLLGSLANLIASYTVFLIAREGGLKRLIGAGLLANLIITVIVGTYLPYILKVVTGVDVPLWTSWILIFSGEFISINILGSLLVVSLKRIHGIR